MIRHLLGTHFNYYDEEDDDDFDMKGVSIGGAVGIGIVALFIVWCCCARRRAAGRVIAPPGHANGTQVIVTVPQGPAPYPQQQYVTATVPSPAQWQVQYPAQSAPYPVAQQRPTGQAFPGVPMPGFPQPQAAAPSQLMTFPDVQPSAPAFNALPPTYDEALRQEQKN